MAINPLRPPPRPFRKRKPASSNNRPHQLSNSAINPLTANQQVENPNDFNQYNIRACTEEEIENVRTHILKFQSKLKVDPHTFSEPIRLHRKETKNLQYQLTRAEIEQRQKENAAEKHRLEAERKEQAEAERLNGGSLNSRYDISLDPNVAPDPVKSDEQKRLEKQEKILSRIGPDANGRKGKQQLKKKTRKITSVNEEVKKLRYEEYYPWVMEDYDGQNTWVGSYEAGNSDSYALLISDGNGFKMVPADKVYRFTPRNKYSTLTLEEAEKRMERHQQIPRWLMKHLDEEEQKLTRYERTKKKLKTVVGTSENDKGGRDSDNDDLDYEEDFQDDEEAPIIDGDEQENKESEKRIKKEMRSANVLRNEDEDDEDDDDLFGDRKVDKEGEKVRKALLKTEMSGLYESDEDENPYFSKSDIENGDEQEEVEKEESVVKSEPGRSTSPRKGRSPDAPTTSVRKITVKSVNSPIGIVVFKALPSVLVKFPKGDWNPKAKKRIIDFQNGNDDRSLKRVKLEDQEAVIPETPSVIKVEEGTSINPNLSVLLTEQDIIDVVQVQKVTAKELIHKLRDKLGKHPENKVILKGLVKKLLKNEEGYLVLKNQISTK